VDFSNPFSHFGLPEVNYRFLTINFYKFPDLGTKEGLLSLLKPCIFQQKQKVKLSSSTCTPLNLQNRILFKIPSGHLWGFLWAFRGYLLWPYPVFPFTNGGIILGGINLPNWVLIIFLKDGPNFLFRNGFGKLGPEVSITFFPDFFKLSSFFF